MIKNILRFASAQTAVTFGNMLFSFFAARILGPGAFGVFQAAKLADDYAEFLYLGMPISFRREIPRLIKEGKKKYVRLIISAILSFGILAYSIYAVIVLIYAGFVANELLVMSLYGVTVMIFFRSVNSLGNIYLKSINNYKLLGWIEVIRPAVLLASILFLARYGLIAAVVSTAIVSVINAIFYFRVLSSQLVFYFRFVKIFKLIKSAFPIYLISVSSILFITLDRFLIATLGSFENLGLYTVGSMVSTPITLIVSSVSLVVFTETNSRMGKEQGLKDLSHYYDDPVDVVVNTVPTILFIGILFMPFVVKAFLPDYVDGIVPAQVLVVGVYIRSLASFGINGLYAIDMHRRLVSFFVKSGLLEIILIVIFLLSDLPLIFVAISSLIGNLCFFLLVSYYIYKLKQSTGIESLRKIFHSSKLLLLLTVGVGIYFMYSPQDVISLIAVSVFIVITGALFAKPLYYKYKR